MPRTAQPAPRASLASFRDITAARHHTPRTSREASSSRRARLALRGTLPRNTHFSRPRSARPRARPGPAFAGSKGPATAFLVGTGPGDPGLLTLRAVQLMQRADVVLYDRLVSDEILDLVGEDATMVYVGKEKGFHSRTQDEIHALMLQFAGEGGTVVRLKGGDPYVFGRGGEELRYLEERGVHVQCVPGITAASGICAELGIPMTHRGVAYSARYLTGHSREGAEEELQAATALAADPYTTLVVYMGLGSLPSLVDRLTQSGMRPDTPAVAVERGTLPEQRTVFAPLSELHACVADAQLKSPTLLIIGDVVALSRGWEDHRGGGVVEGRWVSREQAGEFGQGEGWLDVIAEAEAAQRRRGSESASQGEAWPM
ncbi:unnamed protein product [Pedinophyceae sp. YPF-701]|nr:unnamed protein product [Pedinophyceae sp. YPF-701]